MSIPMVRGFGVLYSKDIIDPSLIISLLLPKVFAETTSQVGAKRVAGSGLVTVANGAERYRQAVFWPRQACHRNYPGAICPKNCARSSSRQIFLGYSAIRDTISTIPSGYRGDKRGLPGRKEYLSRHETYAEIDRTGP